MNEELTKKGTIRKRKPKQKIYYFTKNTEEAILEYVASKDQRHRNKLYKDKIDYAFFKLTQNIINTFKFPYMVGTIEDIQQEVIFFLLTKLPLYTQEKGAAYSYFGTIAKRYLINENNKAYNKIKGTDNLEGVDEDKSIVIDLLNNPNKKEQPFNDEHYCMEMFIQYMDIHSESIFKDSEDIKSCYAVMELFKRRENIEIFNKKALLLYIREMTNQETPQITKIIKKIQKIYNRLNQQYLNCGFISLNF
jgi:hypothetical protein